MRSAEVFVDRRALPADQHAALDPVIPQRMVRSRRRGYRTPPGTIYVGRPTMWGNPFTRDRFGHFTAVRLHRHWLDCELGDLSLEKLGFCPAQIDALWRLRARVLGGLHQLAGRHLQCWCPATAPCHADTLLRLAADHAEYGRLVQ